MIHSSLPRRLVPALLAAALATAAPAAVTVGDTGVQLGGFFSQGYLDSSGNNYPVDNRDGTFRFREMAVNASTTVGARLRLGAQAFAQSIGVFGDDKVLLDWAVADYNVRQEFGLRVGRVKFPKGLYGEALDLDIVRPFIFLPLGLYNPALRDFSASFDGGMLYGTLELGRGGSLDYKVFYGDIPMKPEQGVAEFFNTTGLFAAPGVTAMGMEYTTGLQLVWSPPVPGLRLAASWSYFSAVEGSGRFAYAPAFIPVAPVRVVGDRYTYLTFSAEYSRADWIFAAEWQRTEDTFRVYSTLAPTDVADNGSDAWYISATRRLGSRFEAGAYWSFMKNLHPAAGTPRERRENNDWALSLRFDLNEHVLFKLEGHYVDGSMGLFNTIRVPNPAATRKDTFTYWAAKTTFSF
jgi:hypothetical protein